MGRGTTTLGGLVEESRTWGVVVVNSKGAVGRKKAQGEREGCVLDLEEVGGGREGLGSALQDLMRVDKGVVEAPVRGGGDASH